MATQASLLVCGDSVLDNGAYVGLLGRPLKRHLRAFLDNWQVDFRALDGAVCADVSSVQLGGGGEGDAGGDGAGAFDAVVVSVGGNDALGRLHLLEDARQARLIDFALMLADVQDAFRADYAAVLDAAARHAPAVLALTVYRPRFHLDGMPAELQRAASTLLSLFNDVIQEEAQARGCTLLDLRRICDSDRHFANAIEPGDLGGREIARAIAERVQRLRQ